jgi:hypothetical protein
LLGGRKCNNRHSGSYDQDNEDEAEEETHVYSPLPNVRGSKFRPPPRHRIFADIHESLPRQAPASVLSSLLNRCDSPPIGGTAAALCKKSRKIGDGV